MTKSAKRPSARPKSNPSRERGGKKPKRAPYIVGSDAFGKISAVEGIFASRGLKAALHSLGKTSPERRRATLERIYGKK
jgi:hypothetical protein